MATPRARVGSPCAPQATAIGCHDSNIIVGDDVVVFIRAGHILIINLLVVVAAVLLLVWVISVVIIAVHVIFVFAVARRAGTPTRVLCRRSGTCAAGRARP